MQKLCILRHTYCILRLFILNIYISRCLHTLCISRWLTSILIIYVLRCTLFMHLEIMFPSRDSHTIYPSRNVMIVSLGYDSQDVYVVFILEMQILRISWHKHCISRLYISRRIVYASRDMCILYSSRDALIVYTPRDSNITFRDYSSRDVYYLNISR